MANSQSTSLNKTRVNNMTTLGSVNQINKSDLSASKRRMTKNPVSAVKNGSKANSSVINLLSDSETDEDTKITSFKISFGNTKDTSSRLEPRATRSQIRAKDGFTQFNDTKLSDGKKGHESLRQQSGGSHFVLNSTARTLAPEYKCLLGQPTNLDITECLIPVDSNACKDAILIRKDSQSLQNILTRLEKNGVIEIKAANIKCIHGRNDSKFVSYNQPIVVVNKIKKPFNIKLTSEQRNKTDDFQVSITDVKKTIRFNNSSQNVVKLIDSSCSFADDEKKNRNDKTPWNMFGKTQNIFDTSKKQYHQDSVSKCRTNRNINETNNRSIKELGFDFDQSTSQTPLTELYNGVEEIVEMHSFDNACDKILEIKTEIAQEFNQDFEMMTFVSDAENLMNENESHLAEMIQPKEISVKIANDKLLKAERMEKESEKIKKIENERKKQDDERMQKEDQERKEKEKDRKKKEHEKLLQKELYKKKKKEEEERKLKEYNERKIKDLQEKIKMEVEHKKLEPKPNVPVFKCFLDTDLIYRENSQRLLVYTNLHFPLGTDVYLNTILKNDVQQFIWPVVMTLGEPNIESSIQDLSPSEEENVKK